MSRIVIKDDEGCEMMEIWQDGDCLFAGNYWDFDATPSGIASLLDSLGLDLSLEDYEYE